MVQLFSFRTLLKLMLPAALALGVTAGVLAQEATSEAPGQMALPSPTYVVQAGGNAPANADLLMFFPQNLQVHRGDTVTWSIMGFHNIHFSQTPTPMVIVGELDGQQVPMGNPAALFPTIENGSTYTGGDANSGVSAEPGASPFFSLVIDAEPGTYTYFCDIHPGMAGSIIVVDEGTEIPDAAEVALMADAEMGMAMGMAFGQYTQTKESYPSMPAEGQEAEVYAGIGAEVSNQLFVPETIVINAGESVTWELQEDTREIHTITWPPVPPGSEFVFQEQEGGPPLVLFGPALTPTVQSGAEIGQGDSFNYVISPGEAFSLTFTEPGVYQYVCNLHIGMQGTVVVQGGM